MSDNAHMDCGGQAGGCPECTNFGETQDWHTRTTKSRNEWSINSAGGTREVELNYEYRDGWHGGTSSGYLFLTRDDLVAMLAAIDTSLPF